MRIAPNKGARLLPGQIDAVGVRTRLGLTEQQLQRARETQAFPAYSSVIFEDGGQPRMVAVWLTAKVDEWAETVVALGRAIEGAR